MRGNLTLGQSFGSKELALWGAESYRRPSERQTGVLVRQAPGSRLGCPGRLARPSRELEVLNLCGSFSPSAQLDSMLSLQEAPSQQPLVS